MPQIESEQSPKREQIVGQKNLKTRLSILLPALTAMIDIWGDHDQVVSIGSHAIEQVEQDQHINIEES